MKEKKIKNLAMLEDEFPQNANKHHPPDKNSMHQCRSQSQINN